MRRLSKGSRTQRSASRTSAPVVLRAARVRAPSVLSAAPDPHRRLSAGVLIEGSILARVLGMRLLTLDTTVVLVPAEVRAAASPVALPTTRASTQSSAIRSPRLDVPGRRLAEAVRTINEGAAELSEPRVERSPAPQPRELGGLSPRKSLIEKEE